MAFIYRLETLAGRGVYSANVIGKAMEEFDVDLYYDISRHPSPDNDVRLQDVWWSLPNQDPWYFGFSSKAQMQRWFYRADIRRYLASQGIVMNKYEVPNAFFHRGMNQAIFRKDKAKLVETFTQF